MVGIPTPASPDCLTNPRKGQIPSLDQTQNPSVLMDRPNIGSNFFPSFPFPPIYSTGKQSLSKPRMTKARKSFSSKPRSPSSVPNPNPNPIPGPRPFRSDKIDDMLSRWNPFVPEPGARVSDASTNSDAAVFAFGSGGLSQNSLQKFNSSFVSEVFVFGSGGGGGMMGCDLKRTSSVMSEEGRRLKEETERLNIGKCGNFGDGEGVSVFGSSVEESTENEDVHVFGSALPESLEKMDKLNIKERIVLGSSMNETLEKMEKLNIKVMDTGSANLEAFAFGSSMKESEDKTEKMNIKENFVFGSSINESLEKMEKLNIEENIVLGSSMNETLEKLNIKVMDTGSGNSDAFAFRSSMKESEDKTEKMNIKENFVFGSSINESLEKMEKLNIKDNTVLGSSMKETLEKMEKLNIKVTDTRSGNSEAFAFGSNTKESEDKTKKMNIKENFVFGSSINESLEKMEKLNIKENTVLGSIMNETLEKMEKLNIKVMDTGSGNSDAFAFGSSMKESEDKTEKMNIKENFMFGSSINESLEKMEKLNIKENTVLGSSMKETLEKMEKLNIKVTDAGSGNLEAFAFGSSMKESEDKTEKMNIKENFVFGSSINESLEKMEKLSIKVMHTGSGNSEAFVFGSSMKESEDEMENMNTRQTSTSMKESEDKLEKLNIRETSTRTGKSKEGIKRGDKNKEGIKTGDKSKKGVDIGNSFVPGRTAVSALDHELEKLNIGRASENITDSFGGSAVNTIHDDMMRSKIESKVESFVGGFPSNFSFRVGEQNQSSSMGSVPPFQTTAPPLFHPPPPGPTFQPFGSQFTFGSQHGGSEAPPMEFKTPTQDCFRLTMENLFSGPSQNFSLGGKGGEVRGTKSKKKKGKSRQPATCHQSLAEQFVHVEGGFQKTAEAEPNDGYSPMDCSPYPKDTVADRYSREASVASSDAQRSISVDDRDEVIVSASEHLDISDGNNLNQGGLDDNGPKGHVQGCQSATSFEYEQTSRYVEETDMPKYENLGFDCYVTAASMKAETCSPGPNFERESSAHETGFIFSSSLKECSQSKFTFTSSPFSQGNPPQKRNYRRRSRSKSGKEFSTPNAKVTFASLSPNIFPPISTSQTLDSAQEQKGFSFVSKSEDGSKVAKVKEPEACQEPKTITASSVALQEACDKWRQRGNQAYKNGYLSKAEDYYTRGIKSISLKETASSCIRPLTLCYSNRAATRMSLERMREALCDCKMALIIDPNFLRAQVRAANCYLSLGDIEEALKAFKKCLQKADISSNQKIVTEASDGLHKAQEVADLTDQSAELLLKRRSNDLLKALQIISDALLISPLSENLLEMKSEALLMMRNYKKVIQLCEETLDFAERNCTLTEADSQLKDVVSSGLLKYSPARLWRWRLISKSYFHLGKLEDALELIQKHDKVKLAVEKLGNRSSESSASLSVTIRELLRLKAAGNEAFQAARHSEAVECYTAALLCNAESRPFAAVCFCNRAAAYQALGQMTDAIADCSLAIALDAGYRKAISRRATLHEMIRDYGQAANDLQRLISLLEQQLKGKDNQGGTSGRSIGNDSDLKQACVRLATVKEEARKGRSLDMYLILGIEPSSFAADVKKAYRKAALRHHPDKAGQFLVRNETVNDGLWRELADEVHNDADRLFKIIGESYTILSDPTKRLQYDAEEEMRTSLKKGYNGSTTSKNSADNYSSPYERNTNRRWRAHGNSFYR